MGSTTLVNGYHKALVRNGDSSRKWVVQKFGGTSVGKFADKIAEDIVRPNLREHRIAVVCSARSKNTKVEGTTNRLLRAAREAGTSKSHSYENIINVIRDDHIQAAKSYIKSPDIIAGLSRDIEDECQDLIAFLAAAQRVGEISIKSTDKIISKGEILSSRFMAGLLLDRGVDSEYVDLSDIIGFKIPDGLEQSFYLSLAQTLEERIIACGNKVPVITGYFGPVPGGLLDQIGRGYTDLCAALVAVGVGAEELQVWKEVDGIFTADPRKVPTAQLLAEISPAEAAELTYYGSEVIHPFTMEQVIRARIPIRIKNVKNPRGSGTVIKPDKLEKPGSSIACHGSMLFRTRSASLLSEDQRPKRPTAVTIKHQIIVINVHSNKRSLSHGFFAKIFSTLDKWRLSVDLISTSEVHVSMALHSDSALVSGGDEDEERIVDHDLRGAIEELKRYGTVDITDGMAILSLVGRQMKDMEGCAGRMFSTLGENHINIEMISQGTGTMSYGQRSRRLELTDRIGASEINISCVIEDRDARRAINVIHTNLFTFLE